MKTFLTLLLLLFSSSVLAEDISDFEIEGMSVGDSLLNYFTFIEIAKDKYEDIYDNIAYDISYFDKGVLYSSGYRISNTYDEIRITYKKKDKNYIIKSISGRILYDNNSNNDIQNCYPLKNQIIKNFSEELLKSSNVTTQKVKKEHSGYPGSYTDSYYFDFEDGSGIAVQCYDYSLKEVFLDKLIVKMDSSEYAYDLRYNEY